MKKKGHTPITRVKNPEPNIEDPDWIIWAAWADRITFEEIEKKTGKSDSEVVKIMRRTLKPSSFRLWRKRVHEKSIKHRKKFEYSRKQIARKIKKNDYMQAMKNITIYTGPLCNYCDAAKRLLARNNAQYKEINIATVDGAMDEMIKKANGRRTIPQIFFDDQHIGGYDDIRALEKENKLQEMLK